MTLQAGRIQQVEVAGIWIDHDRILVVMVAQEPLVEIAQPKLPHQLVIEGRILEDAAKPPAQAGGVTVPLDERQERAGLERPDDISGDRLKRLEGTAELAHELDLVVVEVQPLVE